jgi:hypothetical protein
MKLAILGSDSDTLALAAAARDARHEIVWLGDIRPTETAALAQLTAGLPDRSAQWELLLSRAIADAVIVGKGAANSELGAEQIKRLATEAVPLLVVHPIFDTVLTYYEVDMVRREYNAIVQHYNPMMGHPVTETIADWIRDGHPEIGPIHQVSCERQVADATREAVLTHLARDAEFLAAVAGDIRRVTAIGPALNDASYASLQIQMNSSAAASVRWTIGYAKAGPSTLELALRGEDGVATIRVADAENDEQTWQLDVSGPDAPFSETLDVNKPASAAIDRLAESLNESQTAGGANVSTWDAATRAMEVVDATELSLQKGRTIEVFQQQLTERLAFRGTMAAIGCGLILVAFLAVVAVGLLGGAEGIVKQKIAPSWSIVLLAVLAFFLLLQAVPFLTLKSNRNRNHTEQTPHDTRDT